MLIQRRTLLQTGIASAAISLFNMKAWCDPEAKPAAETAMEGLDPYVVYRKMFSSTADGASCCWWYLGTMKEDVPDIGPVATSQVETCMIYKTKNLGDEGVDVSWKEIGVFRDLTTGGLPEPWFNPATGKRDLRRQSFEDGPATYTIHRAPDGVQIGLQQAHAQVQRVRAVFTIANGRVCITQTEDKVRAVDTPDPMPIQTVLKIYADLSELKQPGKESVAALGYYTAKTTSPAAKPLGVTGLMQKAAVDEKLNPLAWERMKAAYPAFFKGDQVDPPWN